MRMDVGVETRHEAITRLFATAMRLARVSRIGECCWAGLSSLPKCQKRRRGLFGAEGCFECSIKEI